jgi:hypothetical protein
MGYFREKHWWAAKWSNRHSFHPKRYFCAKTRGFGGFSMFLGNKKRFRNHSGNSICHLGNSICHPGNSFCHSGNSFCRSGNSFCRSGESFSHSGDSFCRLGKSFSRAGSHSFHFGNSICHWRTCRNHMEETPFSFWDTLPRCFATQF